MVAFKLKKESKSTFFFSFMEINDDTRDSKVIFPH